MMRIVKITLFLFAIFLTQTAFVTVKKPLNPDYIVVKFHADWCGNCLAMGSSFEDLQEIFKDNNIEFVKFDLTDKGTTAKADLFLSGVYIMLYQRNAKTKKLIPVRPKSV